MSFTYNDEGLRTSKTVNGVTTTYYWSGTQLVAEVTPSSVLIYLYEADGSPLGFKYLDTTDTANEWEIYWFEKNLQGDVVAVYSEAGVKLISYRYDAWGSYQTTYYNGGRNTNAVKNSLLYRGYYYDAELCLYYLQSRYYNAAIGRFISADDASYLGANGDMISYNLYAYCSNNPVMHVDPSGYAIISLSTLLIAAAIGALIGFGSKYVPDVVEAAKEDGFQISDLIEPFEDNWQEYLVSTIEGATVGASWGLGLGLGTQAASLGVRIAFSKAITGLGVSMLSSFAVGLGSYLLESKVFKSKDYDDTSCLMAGVSLSVKSAANYGMGLLVGNQGFAGIEYQGINGLLTRTYLKTSIITPIQWIFDKLMQEKGW